MYWETPDLGRGQGWAGDTRGQPPTVGAVLAIQAGSAGQLAQDADHQDDRLVSAKQAVDAYAESWAMTYYLIHKHPKQISPT